MPNNWHMSLLEAQIEPEALLWLSLSPSPWFLAVCVVWGYWLLLGELQAVHVCVYKYGLQLLTPACECQGLRFWPAPLLAGRIRLLSGLHVVVQRRSSLSTGSFCCGICSWHLIRGVPNKNSSKGWFLSFLFKSKWHNLESYSIFSRSLSY